MGDNEVERYLEHLVLKQNVTPRTQATALNSLSFLYKHIIKNELSLNLNFAHSKKQAKLPVVMTPEEVKMLMAHLNKRYYLIAALMYGSGLRVMEAVQLRVKDIDFDYKCIQVWNGKGNKHRIVTLATELIPMLRNQILNVDDYLKLDLNNTEYSGVWMPYALTKKYPSAAKSLAWQYLFPSHILSSDPQSGEIRRHHFHHSCIRKEVKKAVQKSGLTKIITPHTLRHSFATRLYPNHLKMRVSVGIKSDLGKALIASNSGSIVKINNAV
jgi:integron integrase